MNINRLYCYPDVSTELSIAVNQSYKTSIDLSAVLYTNVTILPAKILNDRYAVGGCLDEKDNFIWQSAINKVLGYSYAYEKVNCITDQTYIYIGYMYNCYGHMLGDCLRWLWFVKTKECQSLLKQGAKFVCISIEPLQRYQLELLKLAGVEDVMRIDSVTKVRKLYIPNQSIYTEKEQNYFSDAFNETIEAIINQAKKEVYSIFPSKIYLTRRGWKSDIYGELLVEKYFKKNGFAIVSPEKHSIAEQIAMMNNAHEVVATESSLSHSMIFCKMNTRCHILRKNLHINKYSLFINQMRKLNVSYVDCSLSLFLDNNRWWDGPFFIYPNDNLVNCFVTHTYRRSKLPKYEFAKYLLHSIFYTSNLIGRLTNINYVYAKILQDELVKNPPMRFHIPQNIIKRLIRKVKKYVRQS